MMQYWERMKELRKEMGLTQNEVCVHIPISQRSYSNYETGRVNIPIESLVRLAEFYNVSMNYICGVSDERGSFTDERRGIPPTIRHEAPGNSDELDLPLPEHLLH